MQDDLRDTLLKAMEDGLDAQLRAVRRLRKGEADPPPSPSKSRRSQVDMAYDVLNQCGRPLHINDILERIEMAFGVKVDRDSLGSSLSKKVLREDRFVRTAKNTFGLKGDSA